MLKRLFIVALLASMLGCSAVGDIRDPMAGFSTGNDHKTDNSVSNPVGSGGGGGAGGGAF